MTALTARVGASRASSEAGHPGPTLTGPLENEWDGNPEPFGPTRIELRLSRHIDDAVDDARGEALADLHHHVVHVSARRNLDHHHNSARLLLVAFKTALDALRRIWMNLASDHVFDVPKRIVGRSQ